MRDNRILSSLSALLSVVVCLLLLSPSLAAQVTSTPANYVFDPIALGAVSQYTLSISVPAGTTLGAVTVLTLGAPNLDFTLVPSGTTCGPGVTAGTCNVEVQFQPIAPGRRLGMVGYPLPAAASA